MLAESRKIADVDFDNAGALKQLERSSGAAADAVKAIAEARDTALDNLANADTVAFKQTRTLLLEGGKVKTQRDFTQGSLEPTGRDLDISIQGDGFFQVAVKVGSTTVHGYTRNGALTVNNVGELILSFGNGYDLIPRITLPTTATNISIATDGHVQYLKAGMTQKTTAGQIWLWRFPNPEGLSSLGAGIFTETEASGPPAQSLAGEGGAGQIMSGYLENSNVDITHEMVRIRFLDQWRAELLRAMGMRVDAKP